jgi:hypothetical protein
MSSVLEASRAATREYFDNIIQMLLSAGYFRARIPSLSDFDKVFFFYCEYYVFEDRWRNGVVLNHKQCRCRF